MALPATAPPETDERDELLHELMLGAMGALRAVQHEARRTFEPLGLRPSQVLVLDMIQRGLDQPKVLAEQLETVQSAVTAVLNELQQRSLVTRAADPDDRRRVRVRVTDEGQRALADAAEAWLAATARRLADADIDDLRAADRILRLFARGGAP